MKESKMRKKSDKGKQKSLLQKRQDVRKARDNKEVHDKKKLFLTKDQKESLRKKENFNHSKKG